MTVDPRQLRLRAQSPHTHDQVKRAHHRPSTRAAPETITTWGLAAPRPPIVVAVLASHELTLSDAAPLDELHRRVAARERGVKVSEAAAALALAEVKRALDLVRVHAAGRTTPSPRTSSPNWRPTPRTERDECRARWCCHEYRDSCWSTVRRSTMGSRASSMSGCQTARIGRGTTRSSHSSARSAPSTMAAMSAGRPSRRTAS